MRIKKIACCTDFSENAELAFEAAVEMAEKYHARLELLHVLPPVINPMMSDSEWTIPDDSRDSLLLQLEEKMALTYGSRIDAAIEHERVVLNGHVSTEIINYLATHPVDIVVVGSYGLTGRGIPRSHCEVKDADGNVVGEVTSGTFSPTRKQGIALALPRREVLVEREVSRADPGEAGTSGADGQDQSSRG